MNAKYKKCNNFVGSQSVQKNISAYSHHLDMGLIWRSQTGCSYTKVLNLGSDQIATVKSSTPTYCYSKLGVTRNFDRFGPKFKT